MKLLIAPEFLIMPAIRGVGPQENLVIRKTNLNAIEVFPMATIDFKTDEVVVSSLS